MVKVAISYNGLLEYPECPNTAGTHNLTGSILCGHEKREWIFCKHHFDPDLTSNGKFKCPLDQRR